MIVLPLTMMLPPAWLKMPVPSVPPSSRPTLSQEPTVTAPALRLTVPVPLAAPRFRSLPIATVPVVLMLSVPVAAAPSWPAT